MPFFTYDLKIRKIVFSRSQFVFLLRSKHTGIRPVFSAAWYQLRLAQIGLTRLTFGISSNDAQNCSDIIVDATHMGTSLFVLIPLLSMP